MSRLKNITLLLLLSVVWTQVSAQTNEGDRINGKWLSEAKDGEIEIFRTGSTYYGKLLWGKYVLDKDGKPNHDTLNPDPALRSRELKDMVILTGLVYTTDKWENGNIYDPISGRAYNVNVTLNGADLALRGYIGIPLFGKTTIWKRAND